MELTIPATRTVNATHIKCELAVRYDEEDIPNDFPGRKGDLLVMLLDIETQKVVGWPEGKTAEFSMKVCDCGTYTLLSGDEVLATIENGYVPACVPGEYGDCFEAVIDAEGTLTNWNPRRDYIIDSFFGDSDD